MCLCIITYLDTLRKNQQKYEPSLLMNGNRSNNGIHSCHLCLYILHFLHTSEHPLLGHIHCCLYEKHKNGYKWNSNGLCTVKWSREKIQFKFHPVIFWSFISLSQMKRICQDGMFFVPMHFMLSSSYENPSGQARLCWSIAEQTLRAEIQEINR